MQEWEDPSTRFNLDLRLFSSDRSTTKQPSASVPSNELEPGHLHTHTHRHTHTHSYIFGFVVNFFLFLLRVWVWFFFTLPPPWRNSYSVKTFPPQLSSLPEDAEDTTRSVPLIIQQVTDFFLHAYCLLCLCDTGISGAGAQRLSPPNCCQHLTPRFAFDQFSCVVLLPRVYILYIYKDIHLQSRSCSRSSSTQPSVYRGLIWPSSYGYCNRSGVTAGAPLRGRTVRDLHHAGRHKNWRSPHATGTGHDGSYAR